MGGLQDLDSKKGGWHRGPESSALLHNLSQSLGPGPPAFPDLTGTQSGREGGERLRDWVWLLVPNPFTHQSASLLFQAMPVAMFT